jgi:hypothetical protein
MTYAQQKELVRRSLRNLRSAYRRADSEGEKFERHLDRLLRRTTLISQSDVTKVAEEYRAWQQTVAGLDKVTADAVAMTIV